MPVILSPRDYDAWLDPDTTDLEYLHQILVQPSEQNQMESFVMTPVSTRVNSVKNDDLECIKPSSTQQELF